MDMFARSLTRNRRDRTKTFNASFRRYASVTSHKRIRQITDRQRRGITGILDRVGAWKERAQ